MRSEFACFPTQNTAICLAALHQVYRQGGVCKATDLRITQELLSQLHWAKLLIIRRGRYGGAYLPTDFDSRCLIDIVEAVEKECQLYDPSMYLLDICLRRVLRRTKIVDLFPDLED